MCGIDRRNGQLERHYKSEAVRFGIDLKVFNTSVAGIASKLKNMDAVVIFTNKVSHRARKEVLKAARTRNVPVYQCHSCGVCTLRDCFNCLNNYKEGSGMRKGMSALVLMFGFLAAITTAGAALAAHPLITDDTGTQGKCKSQFEFIGEYGIEKEEGVTEKSLEVPAVPFLSYGITDAIDLVFGLPYRSVTVEDAGAGTKNAVRGATDLSIELKARVYEKDGLSFAVKPGISLPTGDEEKGLGNGKSSYSVDLITTKELKPWAFHFNVGYVRNEYQHQADEDADRKHIWRISLASQIKVVNDLSLVANIGAERNPEKTSDTHPAFILGGVIYSFSEILDIDLGVKAGLNKTETDYTVLAGITWRI